MSLDPLKNKRLAVILACFFVAAMAGGCSSRIGQKKANVVAAEDGEEEEVLDPDGHDDTMLADAPEQDENEKPNGEKTAGEMLVSGTYLVLSLGAAAMPFLALF